MVDLFGQRLIQLALEEDLSSSGDITTQALISESAEGKAELWAKETMVLSGMGPFAQVFDCVDPRVQVRPLAADGSRVGPKQKVAELQGPMRALLVGERTALNILQRMSGIATLAAQAVQAVQGTPLKILDTRKTTPGMRAWSKQAVRHGGAYNHRVGLFDGVLIKDNHIAAVGGSISEALRKARANAPQLVKIEIEVTNLQQLKEAMAEGADVVMLDNMDDAMVAEAVKLNAGKVKLEVSGGITLDRLPKLAALGVDFVSMGALTHSARSMDLSLEIST